MRAQSINAQSFVLTSSCAERASVSTALSVPLLRSTVMLLAAASTSSGINSAVCNEMTRLLNTKADVLSFAKTRSAKRTKQESSAEHPKYIEIIR